jgi:cyclase
VSRSARVGRAGVGDGEGMHLVELGQGVFAWIHPEPRFGNSNVGLVIDADGLTIIDTTATPARGAEVRTAITALTAELDLPIKRVVLSSSRVAFSGGSTSFWPAAFFGTEAVSDQLDEPAHPEVFRRLLPHLAPSFDDEFTTRPITHIVSEPAWLTPAAQGIPVPGEAPANLVVTVGSAGVVFAGALASFGVTPLGLDADLASWADSLDHLSGLGATIVPGHGPPGGAADAADLAGYLRACRAADGDIAALSSGPWDDWTDRRFDAVNVERAARLARGNTDTPAAMLRLLGL